MEYKDTVIYMLSSDYKKRFRAEYWQTKLRYEKLKAYNTKIQASMFMEAKSNMEAVPHDCPLCLLEEQQHAMGQYLHVLELRAVIEGIDLEEEL